MKLRFKTFTPVRLAAFRSSYPFINNQWEKKGLGEKFSSMLWVKIPAIRSEYELVQLVRRSIYPWAHNVGRSCNLVHSDFFRLPEVWFFHRADGQIFGFGDIYNSDNWHDVRRVVFAPSPFDVVATPAPTWTEWATAFKLMSEYGHFCALWHLDKKLEKADFSSCQMSTNLL